ncbi:GyrI-like domain-containing protein [Paenibacillus puldeungensis]|uniref:GyrI-like domain-containing protein n=1 Tax=Paenibacillus puldeungensis TaxID=696536 RepID=A0ABW3RUS1_9BACL
MRTNTRIDWHRKVEEAILRIMGALDEPLDFRQISTEVYSSPYHFHRKFRELTGENVHECLRRLRMERAMHLLRTTNREITDIAFDSGYETLESFSKAFKRVYGLSPTDARKLSDWRGRIYSSVGLHYSERQQLHWFYLNPEGVNSLETKITSFAPKRVVAVENVGDYWGLPHAWEKLMHTVEQHQLFPYIRGSMCVFPDHDPAIPMEKKHSYAAVVVDTDFDNTYGLQDITLPEGLYAVTVHFGSSEEIGPTWDRWMNEWLPDSGWKVDTSRPNFEWYQNQCVPPELQLTFLCTAVVKMD